MSDDFENDKFLANEMAFIQDGCTSNDEVFAAPTIMKPDQRIAREPQPSLLINQFPNEWQRFVNSENDGWGSRV